MSNVNLNETATTQFQDIGGVSLAYPHFGKEGAPPDVCFQHFTGTMNNFDPIHTNRLAQDRPVILVDYRGVGSRSGGEMLDSMPATAADIIAFVKALGLKEIDLFGFSIGGMVAQQVVLDAPALVRRILLAGNRPAGRRRHAGIFARGDGHRPIVRTAPSRNARWTCSFQKSPTSYAHGQGLAQADRRAKAGPRTRSEAPGRRGPSSSLLLNGVVIPAIDRYGDLKKIKQRTLVVNGKDDIMVPTIRFLTSLQQHLPDARLIPQPGFRGTKLALPVL